MTENEFNELFAADDVAELTEAMAAAEAETKAAQPATPAPTKDGVWYVNDGVNADGHTISWYRLSAHGKAVLWFSVDNDIEVPSGPLGKLPAGVTAHAIRAWNATRTASVATTGLAIRVPHGPDDVHIDGQSVRSYVVPRASRWVAEFYGV